LRDGELAIFRHTGYWRPMDTMRERRALERRMDERQAAVEALVGLAETCGHQTRFVDTSPVLAVADPVALSTKVDGCIVVVDSSRTRVASTCRAIAALERVHARIIGVVLNKLTEREAAYYRYDGYYGPRPAAKPEATRARQA